MNLVAIVTKSQILIVGLGDVLDGNDALVGIIHPFSLRHLVVIGSGAGRQDFF